MTHKYHVRQLVRLTRPGFSDSRAGTNLVYEVTRLMPADQTGEFSYRIKSSTGTERAVREGEITERVRHLNEGQTFPWGVPASVALLPRDPRPPLSSCSKTDAATHVPQLIGTPPGWNGAAKVDHLILS